MMRFSFVLVEKRLAEIHEFLLQIGQYPVHFSFLFGTTRAPVFL